MYTDVNTYTWMYAHAGMRASIRAYMSHKIILHHPGLHITLNTCIRTDTYITTCPSTQYPITHQYQTCAPARLILALAGVRTHTHTHTRAGAERERERERERGGVARALPPPNPRHRDLPPLSGQATAKRYKSRVSRT